MPSRKPKLSPQDRPLQAACRLAESMAQLGEPVSWDVVLRVASILREDRLRVTDASAVFDVVRGQDRGDH